MESILLYPNSPLVSARNGGFLFNRGQISFEFLISIVFILIIFVYCLSIFDSRSVLTNISTEKWSSQETADRLARNINNVFLMNDGAVVSDNIYWDNPGQSVALGKTSIQVMYNNTFADAPVVAGVIDLRVSDFNGEIFFKKVDGNVVIDYS